VSQAHIPALFMIPGFLATHGLPPQARPVPAGEHGAWALSHILATAAAAIQQYPGGLLVNYSQMPDAIDNLIDAHFGLGLDAADRAAIGLVKARDAKIPQRVFQPDVADKQARTDEALRGMAARWLDRPYAELERLRRKFDLAQT